MLICFVVDRAQGYDNQFNQTTSRRIEAATGIFLQCKKTVLSSLLARILFLTFQGNLDPRSQTKPATAVKRAVNVLFY